MEKDKYWGIGEEKEVIKKGMGMREKTTESGRARKSGQMREPSEKDRLRKAKRQKEG